MVKRTSNFNLDITRKFINRNTIILNPEDSAGNWILTIGIEGNDIRSCRKIYLYFTI